MPIQIRGFEERDDMSSLLFSRRDFLKISGMGSISLSFGGCGGQLFSNAKENSRPNIILIMADDMGYSDIGCYGGEVETPNLNRLADRGLRFSQFYNAARCCPTRAALMTGLYPHRAGVGRMVNHGNENKGVKGPYQGYLNDECVTIAEVLRQAGYRTLMSGKWHVGENKGHWPTDRGFDRYFGLISGGANYFDITKSKAKGVVRQMVADGKPYTPPKEGFYLTEAFTENAVNFIDEYGKEEQPFFMYVAYTAPHWPLHALPEDIVKYRGKYMKGWDILRQERYERMKKMGLVKDEWELSPRDKAAKAWADVDEARKDLMDHKMAVYAAQIGRMDHGIGRIIEKLTEVGKLDNTLILFLSDNGGCAETGIWGFDNRKNGLPPGGVDSYMSYGLSWANASNTPYRLYKKNAHEGGIATPLIAHWPAGIRSRGRIVNHVGHVIDVMPTLCQAAKTKYPDEFNGRKIKSVDGKSFLDVLKGKKNAPHDTICWEHYGNKAVRQGKWKLVSVNKSKWELYDLDKDRTELNNLSEKYPDKVAELIEIYKAWAIHCDV